MAESGPATTSPDEADLAVMRALGEPIPEALIKTRAGGGGRTLRYVEAQTVMARLDEAAGPHNWSSELELFERHARCRLTVHLPSGKVVIRDGVGGYPDDTGPRGLSAEDMPKAGATDAFKRAGVALGVARHLYDEPATTYAGPAEAAAPARPYNSNGNGSTPAPPSAGARRDYGDKDPTSGRALYAWLKGKEEQGAKGLIKYLDGWGRDLGLPDKYADWQAQDIAEAVAHVREKLAGRAAPAGASAAPAAPPARTPAAAPARGAYGSAAHEDGDDDIPF